MRSAALYVHFGIGPWVGMPVAIFISVASGVVIGFLAFRFGVAGVYFAILTIAFCEFARVGFDHFGWVSGSSGLFLPVSNLHPQRPLESARPAGDVLLRHPGAHRGGLRALPSSAAQPRRLFLAGDPRGRGRGALARHQHVPLQDDRDRGLVENDRAGRRVLCVLLQQSWLPSKTFHILRPIEIILGPIIGGVGTLFGPIIGAFLITGLAEVLQEFLTAYGPRHSGRQTRVLRRLPAAGDHGLAERHWPPLARSCASTNASKPEA